MMPATIQPPWLAELPIWLQHTEKEPYYSGSDDPGKRWGDLDRPADRERLVAFPRLSLADGFEPGYALGPIGDLILCGVDLDQCFNYEGVKSVKDSLRAFYDEAVRLGAMVEVSRSGEGLHVVWLALPEQVPPTIKRAGVECYSRGRYFACGRKVVQLGAPIPLDMRPAIALLPVPPPRAPTEDDSAAIEPAGGRNNWLREQLERLYVAGLRGDALREAVRAQNLRLAVPMDDQRVENTVLQGVDKIQYLRTRATPSEVFAPVDTGVRGDTGVLPSLARPLGDSVDFDFNVVYHLIDNILPAGGMTLLWGESTAGKSFLALDWALHIVYGMPWHGHRVRPGRVLYLAGEGEIGLMKRVVAWRRHYNITEPTGDRFMIHNLQHVTALEALDIDRYSIPQCDLIIPDTLNRWSSGNENKADEMGAWLRVVQRIATLAGDAASLPVHHARKDSDEYRGSTAIRAAADAEFEIAGGEHTVTINHLKSKDEQCIKPMTLMKRVVEVGEKDDGFGGTRMHTSLVYTVPDNEQEKRMAVDDMEDRIINAMRQVRGECNSQNQLVDLVKGKKALVHAKIRQMLDQGRLERVGKYGLRLKVFDDPVFG